MLPEWPGCPFSLVIPPVKTGLRRGSNTFSVSPDHVVLTAEYEGEIIGWIHVHARCLLESEPFAEIAGLIVERKFRGQGIGRTLVKRCGEWTSSAALGKLRVRMNVNRQDAVSFYEQMGFEPVKTQRVFDKSIRPRFK
ncbi:GNAT family N-acetyltransferase [Paenibacillus sp. 1P03SA]|uniref:GNAT family N-acetyltransferase n=1 Tax=Paenibacillus sp. 1P03SA TaxID=3132294 RepID=UPI0039A03254